MQNKSKLPHAQTVDARLPFALCYAIGVVLLTALEVLCYLMDPTGDAALYGLVLLTFFVVVVGCVLLAYLLRVRRLHEVQAAADDMTTEIGDVFKYVIGRLSLLVDYCLEKVTLAETASEKETAELLNARPTRNACTDHLHEFLWVVVTFAVTLYSE